MASGSVFASLPARDLFSFPPNNVPFPQPAPGADSTTIASPPLFTIPDHIFTAALDPRVPLTIAVTYAVTVTALNKYNRANNKRPWAISKTRAFSLFVVVHNVFLALYSAWTCVGMYRTLKTTVASPFGPHGYAATADSLCHMSGAPGLGQAVVFDQGLGSWTSLSDQPQLTPEGLTSASTPGRMWNEGLAFYGWIFYLSKFYEVLDTLIILAKGKPSSTLQTYHHAGAMMAMWAGIRYMASPIWIFVFVNSGIHAMMYTYYTVTSFKIKVPVTIKRTLTTLQITQFLLGGSFAFIHSFVSYMVPLSSTISGLATPEEPAIVPSSAAAEPTAAAVSDMGMTYVEQACITTDGATFAIWLNVVYLAPLTYLFARFFVTSYLRRGKTAAKRRMSSVEQAEKAGWEAARKVEREVYGAGSEDAIDDEEEGEAAPKANGKARR